MENIVKILVQTISAAILISAALYWFYGLLSRRYLKIKKRYFVCASVVVTIGIAAYTMHSSELREQYPALVKPVCKVLATLLLGGAIIWVGCWVCQETGKRLRLWLHRKISRMSYSFAILTCGIVILSPLVVALLMLNATDLVANVVSAPFGNLYKLDVEVLKGYFYAIYSAPNEANAFPLDSLGDNIRLFFGLVGYLIFSGFTVSMFVEMVRSKKDRIEQGEERYPDLRNHYVIIGSGFLLETVIREINAKPTKNKRVLKLRENIVILSSEHIAGLRKRLSARLSEDSMKRLIFMHGDRTNVEDLQQLCLESCLEIFLTGDSREADMDDRNLESLAYINDILRKRRCGGKKCKIFLERYHTYSLFQGFIKDTNLDHLDVEPICFAKHWAEVVLGLRSPCNNDIQYPPMDGEGIGADSDKYMHLVVIGMSRMGMSLVTESAMLMHFPNSGRKRTRITMIDLNAKQEMYKFTNLHQSLFAEAYYTYSEYDDTTFGDSLKGHREYNHDTGWLDTEFHFIQGNVESQIVRRLLESFVQDDAQLTVAVCLPDARHALSLSLSLPKALYNRPNVSILVQQGVGAGLLNLLSKQTTKDPHYRNILPFGMLNENVGTVSEVDELAPFAGMTYIPGCSSLYQPEMLLDLARDKEAIDKMRAEWNAMQPWARISNRYAAASRKYKLRSVGLGDEANPKDRVSSIYDAALNPEIFGEMEHNRWCLEKLIVGFRTLTKEEQNEVDACPMQSAQRSEKISNFKKERFAHVGIRPWSEIRSHSEYRDFYLNSINMGRAICILPEIKKVADEMAGNAP